MIFVFSPFHIKYHITPKKGCCFSLHIFRVSDGSINHQNLDQPNLVFVFFKNGIVAKDLTRLKMLLSEIEVSFTFGALFFLPAMHKIVLYSTLFPNRNPGWLGCIRRVIFQFFFNFLSYFNSNWLHNINSQTIVAIKLGKQNKKKRMLDCATSAFFHLCFFFF